MLNNTDAAPPEEAAVPVPKRQKAGTSRATEGLSAPVRVCDSDYAPCLYAETDRAVFVNSKAPKPEPVERGETAAKISHHSHRREPGEVNEWVLYMCTLSEGMCLPHFNSLYYYYSCYILSRCPMFTSNHTDAMISLF